LGSTLSLLTLGSFGSGFLQPAWSLRSSTHHVDTAIPGHSDNSVHRAKITAYNRHVCGLSWWGVLCGGGMEAVLIAAWFQTMEVSWSWSLLEEVNGGCCFRSSACWVSRLVPTISRSVQQIPSSKSSLVQNFGHLIKEQQTRLHSQS
jgi:hypothetical protein